MAGRHFGRHLGFVHGLVREHGLADQIADGEDVGHVGALLTIDRNKTAGVDVHPGVFSAELFAVWHPADGQQHAVEQLGRRIAWTFEKRAQAARFGLDAGDLGFEQDLFVALVDFAAEGPHQIRIGARHEYVEKFDHADLGAERVVNRRHFKADDAAADDQEAAGHVLQLEGPGRIDEAGIVRETRQFDRSGAGGEDGLFEAHGNDTAVRGLDFGAIRSGKAGLAGQNGDLALFGHGRKTAGQPRHDAVFPGPQGRQVDLRRAEGNAVGAGSGGFVDHLRHV